MRRHGHKRGKRVARAKGKAEWRARKLSDFANWGYRKVDPWSLDEVTIFKSPTKPTRDPEHAARAAALMRWDLE